MVIERVKVIGVPTGPLGEGGDGFYITEDGQGDPSERVRIRNSEAHGNGRMGVAVVHGREIEIERFQASGNLDGLHVDASGASDRNEGLVFRDIVAWDNKFGVRIGQQAGVTTAVELDGVTVHGNVYGVNLHHVRGITARQVLSFDNRSYGIWLEDVEDVRFLGAESSGNGDQGWVLQGIAGSVLRDIVARGNDKDGVLFWRKPAVDVRFHKLVSEGNVVGGWSWARDVREAAELTRVTFQ